MAKDVDLSSKEWRDLIFEGKNKEYGAYELRAKSDGRHNRAMIVVVIFIAIIFGLTFVIGKLQVGQEDINSSLDAMAQLATLDEVEEEEEEEEQEMIYEEPPEVPEALPEELLNTMMVTELAIVNDDEVTQEIKNQDEIMESQTALGATDFDQGTDDLNVVREHKEEVIVEEKTVYEENHVFQSVEQMPQFPGGDAELMKYLSNNIHYPTIAAENGIQGRVTVQFVVKRDGSVGEVKVVRGKDPDLDKEAVRVVKTLPNFIPGKMNGQPVNVWFTLPVNFRLAN